MSHLVTLLSSSPSQSPTPSTSSSPNHPSVSLLFTPLLPSTASTSPTLDISNQLKFPIFLNGGDQDETATIPPVPALPGSNTTTVVNSRRSTSTGKAKGRGRILPSPTSPHILVLPPSQSPSTLTAPQLFHLSQSHQSSLSPTPIPFPFSNLSPSKQGTCNGAWTFLPIAGGSSSGSDTSSPLLLFSPSSSPTSSGTGTGTSSSTSLPPPKLQILSFPLPSKPPSTTPKTISKSQQQQSRARTNSFGSRQRRDSLHSNAGFESLFTLPSSSAGAGSRVEHLAANSDGSLLGFVVTATTPTASTTTTTSTSSNSNSISSKIGILTILNGAPTPAPTKSTTTTTSNTNGTNGITGTGNNGSGGGSNGVKTGNGGMVRAGGMVWLKGLTGGGTVGGTNGSGGGKLTILSLSFHPLRRSLLAISFLTGTTTGTAKPTATNNTQTHSLALFDTTRPSGPLKVFNLSTTTTGSDGAGVETENGKAPSSSDAELEDDDEDGTETIDDDEAEGDSDTAGPDLAFSPINKSLLVCLTTTTTTLSNNTAKIPSQPQKQNQKQLQKQLVLIDVDRKVEIGRVGLGSSSLTTRTTSGSRNGGSGIVTFAPDGRSVVALLNGVGNGNGKATINSNKNKKIGKKNKQVVMLDLKFTGKGGRVVNLLDGMGVGNDEELDGDGEMVGILGMGFLAKLPSSTGMTKSMSAPMLSSNPTTNSKTNTTTVSKASQSQVREPLSTRSRNTLPTSTSNNSNTNNSGSFATTNSSHHHPSQILVQRQQELLSSPDSSISSDDDPFGGKEVMRKQLHQQQQQQQREMQLQQQKERERQRVLKEMQQQQDREQEREKEKEREQQQQQQQQRSEVERQRKGVMEEQQSRMQQQQQSQIKRKGTVTTTASGKNSRSNSLDRTSSSSSVATTTTATIAAGSAGRYGELGVGKLNPPSSASSELTIPKNSTEFAASVRREARTSTMVNRPPSAERSVSLGGASGARSSSISFAVPGNANTRKKENEAGGGRAVSGDSTLPPPSPPLVGEGEELELEMEDEISRSDVFGEEDDEERREEDRHEDVVGMNHKNPSLEDKENVHQQPPPHLLLSRASQRAGAMGLEIDLSLVKEEDEEEVAAAMAELSRSREREKSKSLGMLSPSNNNVTRNRKQRNGGTPEEDDEEGQIALLHPGRGILSLDSFPTPSPSTASATATGFNFHPPLSAGSGTGGGIETPNGSTGFSVIPQTTGGRSGRTTTTTGTMSSNRSRQSSIDRERDVDPKTPLTALRMEFGFDEDFNRLIEGDPRVPPPSGERVWRGEMKGSLRSGGTATNVGEVGKSVSRDRDRERERMGERERPGTAMGISSPFSSRSVKRGLSGERERDRNRERERRVDERDPRERDRDQMDDTIERRRPASALASYSYSSSNNNTSSATMGNVSTVANASTVRGGERTGLGLPQRNNHDQPHAQQHPHSRVGTSKLARSRTIDSEDAISASGGRILRRSRTSSDVTGMNSSASTRYLEERFPERHHERERPPSRLREAHHPPRMASPVPAVTVTDESDEGGGPGRERILEMESERGSNAGDVASTTTTTRGATRTRSRAEIGRSSSALDVRPSSSSAVNTTFASSRQNGIGNGNRPRSATGVGFFDSGGRERYERIVSGSSDATIMANGNQGVVNTEVGEGEDYSAELRRFKQSGWKESLKRTLGPGSDERDTRNGGREENERRIQHGQRDDDDNPATVAITTPSAGLGFGQSRARAGHARRRSNSLPSTPSPRARSGTVPGGTPSRAVLNGIVEKEIAERAMTPSRLGMSGMGATGTPGTGRMARSITVRQLEEEREEERMAALAKTNGGIGPGGMKKSLRWEDQPPRPASVAGERRKKGSEESQSEGSGGMEGMMKRMMGEMMGEFQSRIGNDIKNLHLEMIRQSWSQRNELKSIVDRSLRGELDTLRDENRSLREENEMLRREVALVRGGTRGGR